MKIHEFTLILKSRPSEAKTERLYGICQDATLAVHAGTGQVHFHRAAKSLENALRSALADVREAGLTVQRVEMAPDALLLQA
jgi:hypothetical protein